jgi:hypothetical protein
MPEVRCTVSNCEYWAQQNYCSADVIQVTAGPPAGKDKHGRGAERYAPSPVQLAEDSYCWTFEARQEAMEEEEELEAVSPGSRRL